MPSKLALLIDAENISYKDLQRILEEVPRHGELVLRAVYGDWDNPMMQKWREIAEVNNFKIRHQSNAAKTKNSSDMKLIMDAMEILYRTQVDTFCLVSNDADYVPLCDKIHEAKKQVIGVGSTKASEAFIRACDTFIFIGRGDVPIQPSIKSLLTVPVEVPAPAPQPPIPPPAPTNDLALMRLLLEAFTKTPQDANQWVTLPELGSMLRQIQPDFQANNYGHAKLSKLLQSMPDFVELQVEGSDILARLKNSPPAKQLQLNNLQILLSEAFAKAPQDAKGWVELTALGNALRQVQPHFQKNSYGHATLGKLLQSMPDFVELRGKGIDISARLKRQQHEFLKQKFEGKQKRILV